MANNEVRIISGQWKGRKLAFPDRPGLRPTLGRVRETLFNWLAPVITNARCLDLYAGSGALGFEALSRGAAEVTFVERDRRTAHALTANAARLNTRVDIRTEPAARFLARAGRGGGVDRFDIVFFDPPFAGAGVTEELSRVIADLLAADGLLYLERPRRSAPSAADLAGARVSVFREATAGDCWFALLEREGAQPPCAS